jgi:hypothetical protein
MLPVPWIKKTDCARDKRLIVHQIVGLNVVPPAYLRIPIVIANGVLV